MVFDWTPAERRGVAVVALLLAIGTVYDLVRSHGPTPAPRSSDPPASGDGQGTAGVGYRIPAGTGTPSIEEAGPGSSAAPPLDLNRASAAELDVLPGIGPVLAGRIVAYREAHGAFRAVEDLLDVPGIGPTLLERMRGRVRIGARAPGGP